MGENFHDRYNFYNARIDFIFGERGVLVVYSKRIKKDGDVSIISMRDLPFSNLPHVLVRFPLLTLTGLPSKNLSKTCGKLEI